MHEILLQLKSSISAEKQAYVIVDALDEYPEHWRPDLLENLQMLEGFGCSVNVFITSRPHIQEIHDLRENKNCVVLDIQSQEHDIQKHIDWSIDKRPNLLRVVQVQPDLRGKIHTSVCKAADGMYVKIPLNIVMTNSVSGSFLHNFI